MAKSFSSSDAAPQHAAIRSMRPNMGRSKSTFDSDLRSTIGRLRETVADVLSACGGNAREPNAITRDIGVDKTLAYKLARIVRETDPYSAALDVPGPEAMRIFARAARSAGASTSILASLDQSVASFQEIVTRHCGDRSTLDMLVANSSAGSSPKQQQQLETFRKSMFRSASAVFGVQARVHVSSHYIMPNKEDPEMVDLSIVGGLVDFTRIRSDVEWAVASMRQISHPGSTGDVLGNEPLDPRFAGENDVPLLGDFCSMPLQAMKVVPFGNDLRKFVLEEGSVGVSNAATLFTGWTRKKICSRWQMSEDDDSEHFVSMSTPAELVIHDLFIHRDLSYALNPSTYLYNQLPGAIAYPNGPKESGLLQLAERIQDLGGCPPQATSPDVPAYSQLVNWVIERNGHKLNEFHGVRLQMRFPPIPSMLLYRYPMPARPQDAS